MARDENERVEATLQRGEALVERLPQPRDYLRMPLGARIRALFWITLLVGVVAGLHVLSRAPGLVKAPFHWAGNLYLARLERLCDDAERPQKGELL